VSVSARLKILMVTPELSPYAKVGGLADVVGALTRRLHETGHDVRVLCPRYGSIPAGGSWRTDGRPIHIHLGGGHTEYARVWECPYPRTEACVYFLEYDHYYARHEIYTGPWGGHADNHERFAFLSRAAIDIAYHFNWYPDVIHCHDWTTGLVPVILNTTERHGALGRTASVFTIHNLEHQGIFSPAVLDFVGLPREVFRPDNLESVGNVNMMKGGLYNATKLTTVSPTYAREIQTPELGCGLNFVLKFRAADLIGVLNGIDTEEWNPANDPHLPQPYSARDLSGKAACKAALQRRFGLAEDPDVPIFGVVSRLWHQKGLDLLAAATPRLMDDMAVQLVLVGTGDPALEDTFRGLAARYPGRFGTFIGYDNALSHLVEAGSDFFLMPSRFEPCGLNQLYSQAYGTLPVARATGGLVDTIEQYVEGQGKGTGFLFYEPSENGLYYTIGWACSTWYDRPEDYRAMQLNAMSRDLSWEKSARTYEQVYAWAVAARAGKEPAAPPREEAHPLPEAPV